MEGGACSRTLPPTTSCTPGDPSSALFTAGAIAPDYVFGASGLLKMVETICSRPFAALVVCDNRAPETPRNARDSYRAIIHPCSVAPHGVRSHEHAANGCEGGAR